MPSLVHTSTRSLGAFLKEVGMLLDVPDAVMSHGSNSIMPWTSHSNTPLLGQTPSLKLPSNHRVCPTSGVLLHDIPHDVLTSGMSPGDIAIGGWAFLTGQLAVWLWAGTCEIGGSSTPNWGTATLALFRN